MAVKHKDNLLDKLKQASLKEMFELEIENQKAREEKRIRVSQSDIKASLKREKQVQDLQKLKQKTNEYADDIKEAKKHATRAPLQQYNVASLIMEMEPRFANLGKYFTSLQMQLFQEYIAKPFSDWRTSVNHEKVVNHLPKHKKNEPIDIPDLQYFANMNDDCSLEADFVPAFVKDFVVKRDEYGEPIDHYGNRIPEGGQTVIDDEKAEIFQQAFQQGVEEWLSSLDDVRDGEKGYFIHKEGDKYRIYHKSFSKVVNGVLTLNGIKVLDSYEPADCDYNPDLDTYIPKPNARPKPGKDPICMQPEEFNRLRENNAKPKQSLGYFLEQHFAGMTFEHINTNTFRP